MNFLAPLFLLGALAIAGPVIFHLIRRTTKDRQRFGSLMFLSPTPPRLTKRSRIEHWLLLLLRAAALALLALAFARPFFRAKATPVGDGKGGDRTVVLVDQSASLRREGMWEEAKERAITAVEDASSNGEVALLAFDREVSPLMRFEDWHRAGADARMALVRDRLSAVSPSWSGTNVAAALMAAAEMLAEAGGNSADKHGIVLITDGQEGCRVEALQGYDWPKGVSVRIETIAPKHAGNAGLQLAAETGAGATENAVQGARLRVSNSSDAQGESFQTGWQAANGEFDGKAQDVYVPPGQSRIVVLPWPQDGSKNGRAMLRGDAVDFDNVVSVTPPPSVTVPVIHSGGGPESPGPLFFLQKALPAGRSLTASVVTHAPNVVPAAEVLKTAPLWIVTAAVEAPVATAVEAYASGGGTALIMLGSTDMAPTLQVITGSPELALTEVKPPRAYALLGTIDFAHSLFSAFAEPRFSDFTKIRFWKYRKLDPAALKDAAVVARFDSADPAVVEVKRGKGRVLILASGWHQADSQLALSSKFPSLLGTLLASTGAGAPLPAQFFAGEPVPASSLMPPNVDKANVAGPGGKSSNVARAETFTGFVEPGWYRVTWDGGQREVAVNTDPLESRTAPLVVEEFEKLGAPIENKANTEVKAAVSEDTPAAAEESEGRQKIWRWLIAGVFAVLLIETLLGTRTARRYDTVEGGSTA